MMNQPNKRTYLLLALLASLLLIGVFVVWPKTSPFDQIVDLMSAYYHPVRQFVDLYQVESMLIYFSISSLLVALCLPGFSLIGLTGGLLLSLHQAFICALLGVLLGTLALRLYLPALLMKLGIQKWLNNHYVIQAQKALSNHPFLYLLTARLIPVLPFTMVNFISCVLKAPFRPLLLATLLGMMPRIIIYIMIGSQLRKILLAGEQWNYHDLLSLNMILSLWFMALLALLPAVIKRQIEHRRNNQAHQ